MAERSFTEKTDVLHIPVKDSEKLYYIQIKDTKDQLLAEYRIGITRDEPDFYVPFYLGYYPSEEIVLTADDAEDGIFDRIEEGGSPEERPDLYPNLYKETDRQQIHFSPKRGWMNDPNGLVYAGGEFRMCFQHNPWGPNHAGVNVGWGLAVSSDGVHFKEYPDAILSQDPDTFIASGSAIVDEDNITGLGTDTIIAVYTALRRRLYDGRTASSGSKGQMLAVSTDGGYSFRRLTDGPIIPAPGGVSWRDPKILRVEKGSLCIAVYETFEGKNCVSFYTSRDSRNWTFRSRTMDLYECPDLFELPVQETGEKMWVLYGAGGAYRVGYFRNYNFDTVSEGEFLDYGKASYAGQTWNSHPDQGSRYHIAWLHDDERPWYYDAEKNCGAAFAQSMTVMCRFTLHKTYKGYRLFRTPIGALKELEMESRKISAYVSGGRAEITLNTPGNAELQLNAESPLSLRICGERAGFSYDPKSGTIHFFGGKNYTPAGTGTLKIRIITDVRSAEIFINEEAAASYFVPEKEKVLEILGDDASVCGTVCRMRSIWK